MSMTMIVVLIVLGIVAAAVSTVMLRNWRGKKLLAILGRLTDFTATRHQTNADCTALIALDEKRDEICLIRFLSLGEIKPDELPPKEELQRDGIVRTQRATARKIISVELVEDGVSVVSVTKTSRISQVGGAVVGGVLLGGVGAVVGALTGKTVTRTAKTARIDLRIVIDEPEAPLLEFALLAIETNKGSFIYKNFSEKGRHWAALVSAMIRHAEADANNGRVAQRLQLSLPDADGPGFVADELHKLSDLAKAGVLTQDEFNQQKAKLLAAGTNLSR